MKFRHLIACGILAAPLFATARPASPEIMTVSNPDGTTLLVRAHGNENFSFLTDPDFKYIIEKNADGVYSRAVRNGRKLTTSQNDINLLRSESEFVLGEPRTAVSRMAALDNQGRTTYPTIGDVRGLVILVEYADTPFCTDDPRQTFDDLCNMEGYSAYGSRGSARDYYIATSNGKFRPSFDVYGPVRLQHGSAWYVGGADPLDPENYPADPTLPSYPKNARFGAAIQEAVTALDDKINFADYDLDGDGLIDNIFFFYSGYGQADNTGNYNLVWPHQADFLRYTDSYEGTLKLPRLKVDGVEVRTYACSNELNGSKTIPADKRPYIDGIGAFVHEFGHVLGLPDLYDTRDLGTKAPGMFSVMDTGSYNNLSTQPPHFSSYEKWVCRWLEYTDAVNGETYDIPPMSSDEATAVRLRIRKPGSGNTYYNEYYLLESRTPDNWDGSLNQYGMYIWHINYNRNTWENNIVNSGRANVEIIASDPGNERVTWPGEENIYTYLTPEMNQALTPYNYPNYKAWLSNISYNEETGHTSVEVNKYTEYPDVATVLHDNPTVDQLRRNIYLNWDPVEDAVNYLLTVTYKNALGNTMTYPGYSERSMGNVTTGILSSVPLSVWENEFHATVKVVTHYPSKSVSNEIIFIPSELADQSGIENIGDEDVVAIYAANGNIYAPESAKIYNINGVEVSGENVPSGIYIVNYAGKSVKLIVK